VTADSTPPPPPWPTPAYIKPEHAHAYWIGRLEGLSQGWLECMEEYDIKGEPEDG